MGDLKMLQRLQSKAFTMFNSLKPFSSFLLKQLFLCVLCAVNTKSLHLSRHLLFKFYALRITSETLTLSQYHEGEGSAF